jgi:hypothetical protein
MQSNIDGSLAVRVIQGFVSQSGIISLSSPKEVLWAGIFLKVSTGTFIFIKG